MTVTVYSRAAGAAETVRWFAGFSGDYRWRTIPSLRDVFRGADRHLVKTFGPHWGRPVVCVRVPVMSAFYPLGFTPPPEAVE